MKLLVTGGAGFIGSNFIGYWLKKYPKDEIVNLDVLTYAGNLENLSGVEKDPRYKFVKGDICDEAAVDQVISGGIELIIHFAAESHVDRSIDMRFGGKMNNHVDTFGHNFIDQSSVANVAFDKIVI
jgi:dTDP-glucose 4,6-dehydratase